MMTTPATDRLRAWVATQASARAADLDACRGADWTQLTEAEEQVFDLTLAAMPALVATFIEWEVLIGQSDGGAWPEMEAQAASIRAEHPFIEAIRAKRAAGTLTPGEVVEGFQRFAALFGISHRAAHAFHTKRLFWDIRRRLVQFRDEA